MGLQTHGWIWRALVSAFALALVCAAIWGRVPEPDPVGWAVEDSVSASPDSISLRILNGSGRSGLARTVQRFFLGSGGGTVYLTPFEPSDADRDDYEITIIVSHIPGTAAASTAAGLLGLGDSCIVWSLESEPEADLTLYLGRDVADRRDTLIPIEQ